MVMIRGFEFSMRELAGGLGDLGTFLPFTIGYIAISGFDPTGIMVGIGLTHIILALSYKFPLPVQPMKVIGALEMLKVVKKVGGREELVVLLITAITSVIVNFALGVFVGALLHYLVKRIGPSEPETIFEVW